MSEELNELQENAEHARHNPDMAPVSLTMAVLAVLVATVSLMGHRSHTEEVVMQNKSSDQWAYYQAKSIRRHADEQVSDLAGLLAPANSPESAKLRAKYQTESEKYKDELKELEAKAREKETETEVARKHADRYDLGEVALEVGLVITSITLLSGRRIFWHLGILMGFFGTLVAASALLIH